MCGRGEQERQYTNEDRACQRVPARSFVHQNVKVN